MTYPSVSPIGLSNSTVMEPRNVVTRGGGHVNGRPGRTNGLGKGNGRTNGLANGIGRTNGLTNGLTGSAPQLAYGCNLTPQDPVCYQFLSFLELVIEWDRRDDKLEPRNGWFASLSIQRGGGFLGGVLVLQQSEAN